MARAAPSIGRQKLPMRRGARHGYYYSSSDSSARVRSTQRAAGANGVWAECGIQLRARHRPTRGRGVLPGLRCRVPLVFSGAYDGSSERVSDTWLGQTWKWMSESKLSMRLRGLKALVCKADPLLHTAFTTARDKAESRAACARFRVMRRSDLMQYDGEQLRAEARADGEWEQADGGNCGLGARGAAAAPAPPPAATAPPPPAR